MYTSSTVRIRSLAVILLAAAIVAGCANTPLRTDSTTSGIQAAESIGAADIPAASQYLLLAKDGLARAKGLSQRGQSDEAASMLARAEADAEMAVLLSREDAVKTEALDAIERVRLLRKDLR